MALDQLQVLSILLDDGNVRLERVQDQNGRHCLGLSAADQPGFVQGRQRLLHEERLLRSVSHPGVPVVLEMVEDRLLLQDCEGEPLSSMPGAFDSPLAFLKLALRLSEIVAAIHGAGILLRRIDPGSILVGADPGQATLISFGRAIRVAPGAQIEAQDQLSLRDLPYTAPESTGRMNRPVDQRSDLYSLGAVFYEILAGRPPFSGKGANEIIHAHIARHPEDLTELCPALPLMIARIVMRLLEKAPTERYQSAHGLQADLNRCLQAFEASGKIDEFIPGDEDRSDRFLVGTRLYGRSKELEQLHSDYERSLARSVALSVVEGPAGSGKSALIREMLQTASARGGFFLSGKYEQYERNAPYLGWLRALTQMVRLLLREEESTVDRWRTRIVRALGSNAGVICQVIPELERIIGEAPPIPDLPARESRNRFQTSMLRFVQLFAQREHPLTVFLDDLHWADTPSLELLRTLVIDADARYLHVIVSYRPGTDDVEDPVRELVSDLQEMGHAASIMKLRPLGLPDLTELIVDTLNTTAEEAMPLAQLLQLRTHGNPFFVGQLLNSLHRDGLLRFHPRYGRWVWDPADIGRLQVTENVIEFMAARIDELAPSARRLLETAACLGNRFSRDAASAVSGLNATEFDQALQELTSAGLLIEQYHDTTFEPYYLFLHDQVQRAAYKKQSEAELAQVHRRAAIFLTNQQTLNGNAATVLFELVGHWNASRALVKDPPERLQVARLNLEAASRARENAAHGAALKYARVGLELLPPDPWSDQYELTYSLNLEALQSEYLNGHYEAAESLAEVIAKRARDAFDAVRVYNLRVTLLTNMGRHSRAIRTGIEGLRRLNYRLPEHPGVPRVLLTVLRVTWRRRGSGVNALEQLPEIKDRRAEAILNLLMAITPSAFFINQNLFAVTTLRMVLLSLRYGNSNVSAYAYMTYAVLLVHPFGRRLAAHAMGRMALRMNADFDNAGLRSPMHVIYGSFINHWVDDMRRNTKYLRTAFRAGLEAGDHVYAGYALANRIFASVARGDSLAEQDRQARSFLRFTDRTGDRDVENDFLLVLQANRHLRGLTRALDTWDDGEYDTRSHEEEMQSGNPVTLIFFHVLRLQSFYLIGALDQALETARKCRDVLEPALGLVLGPEFYFWEALTLAASMPRLSSAQRVRARRRLRKSAKYFESIAVDAPMNFEARANLVAAEYALANGEPDLAGRCYGQARRAGTQSESHRVQALILDRSGRYLSSLGLIDAGRTHMAQAVDHYRQWGASAVVERLMREFKLAPADVRADATRTGITSASSLDVQAIGMASRAISREIVLPRLHQTLMEILMVQGGARRGFLIQEIDGVFRVRARGDVEQSPSTTAESCSLEEVEGLPLSVVHYVLRTGESVVLGNALTEGMFRDDPSIRTRSVRSLLCAPIMLHGRLAGVLYLENDAVEGAFTRERLELLSVLSAQAAVSLENALLYSGLEDKVREKTRELRETLHQVQDLKLRQDSDYYLTSLLIRPLSRVEVLGSQTEVGSFVRQKKQFRFKKWEEQIGGDICLARTVFLNGQSYTVFLNADAMGKSIQGAGGALVLGAVFESIVHEARETGSNVREEPAEWLRRLVFDLNAVFCSFAGYMLVSVAVGVLHDESGVLHYINADHPSTVLLRNDRATFIEEVHNLPKLGAHWLPFNPVVVSLQLERGDILVAGSDGRDDLIREGSDRVQFSEDPSQFRTIVETTHANLEAIVSELDRLGQPGDDLSLLRLQWHGPGMPGATAKPP
ncbi:MAG: AAA family ATPase [Spirochaetales bacterium]|nr:AAA family ATPase [Leptospiraceae bacterium]MCP5482061.1 AAA family ATPase [Spirochaetales bacterium]MCP5484983.1 AAA family ATPase [Spirochaetales bacterium]